MTERTSVNGAPCVRDRFGNEWYATDEGGIFIDGADGEPDRELHGEDLRWLLSSEARGEPRQGDDPIAAVADVLDVGDGPSGQVEVVLTCSREQARAWGPLLYKSIKAVEVSREAPYQPAPSADAAMARWAVEVLDTAVERGAYPFITRQTAASERRGEWVCYQPEVAGEKFGPTPDAARIAAAKALRETDPSLPQPPVVKT